MATEVHIAGVGMIPFTKYGRSKSCSVIGERAVREARADAGIECSLIRQACIGYIYGHSASGRATVHGLGQAGSPIVNVNNDGSTGSSALGLARQAVASGALDCALVLRFEQVDGVTAALQHN